MKRKNIIQKIGINKLIDIAVPIINLMIPIKYSPNGEYSHQDFLTLLIDYTSKNVSWRKYKGTIDCPIDGRYLNANHNNYVKNGVYDEINRQALFVFFLNKC